MVVTDKEYTELSKLVLAHHKQLKEIFQILESSAEFQTVSANKLNEIDNAGEVLGKCVLKMAEQIKELKTEVEKLKGMIQEEKVS